VEASANELGLMIAYWGEPVRLELSRPASPSWKCPDPLAKA
jgi:hypothetical protein